MKPTPLDQIGYWSEVKLEIVRKYARAYSTILASQPGIRDHLYIDAFAGAGSHISRQTGAEVAGSPAVAAATSPPFSELHFIDLDETRTEQLKRLQEDDNRVHVHEGDCNTILIESIFPRCLWIDRRRALCLLDPNSLDVNWEVLQTAGQMKSVEIFYNFMIMDANMNVLWKDPTKVSALQVARMDAVWGDNSWRQAAYRLEPTLFGDREEKGTNEDVAEAFRQRLKSVAGFRYVPEPMPMRNRNGAVIYYLFFASPNEVGARIVTDIFNKYRNEGAA